MARNSAASAYSILHNLYMDRRFTVSDHMAGSDVWYRKTNRSQTRHA